MCTHQKKKNQISIILTELYKENIWNHLLSCLALLDLMFTGSIHVINKLDFFSYQSVFFKWIYLIHSVT